YHICHIRILAYNSQSNGIIKMTHRTICDGLVKMYLVRIHNKVLVAHYASICEFERKNINQIHDYDFSSSELVLVLNKKIKPNVGHKCKPRYFRPMVVVRCLQSRAYILTEVNSVVSCLKFTILQLILYHPQSHK
ncbi:hypothetical protein AN958_10465, partial [Leucoagaricus sp. SymC.cos]